jgi:hypothetical protein
MVAAPRPRPRGRGGPGGAGALDHRSTHMRDLCEVVGQND